MCKVFLGDCLQFFFCFFFCVLLDFVHSFGRDSGKRGLSFRNVVESELNCSVVVSKFELRSGCWFHFWTNTPGKGFICLCLPPDRTWHKVNDMKVGSKSGLGEGKVGFEPRLEPCWTLLEHRLTKCNVSLMSLSGHGPKHGSRHGCLIIAKTGQRGPLLYMLVNGCCTSTQSKAEGQARSYLSLPPPDSRSIAWRSA